MMSYIINERPLYIIEHLSVQSFNHSSLRYCNLHCVYKVLHSVSFLSCLHWLVCTSCSGNIYVLFSCSCTVKGAKKHHVVSFTELDKQVSIWSEHDSNFATIITVKFQDKRTTEKWSTTSKLLRWPLMLCGIKNKNTYKPASSGYLLLTSSFCSFLKCSEL